jgi:hypothetical protein
MFCVCESKSNKRKISVAHGTTLLLTCFLVLSGLDTPPAVGRDIPSRSYPVPIRIDFGQCVESSLCFKCKSKDYHLAFDDFIARELDARERALQRLILALRDKNVPACLQVAFREPCWTQDRQRQNEQLIEKMANRFTKFVAPAVVGSNFEKLRVTNQFLVGTGGIFICAMDVPSSLSPRLFRIAYTFQTNTEGKFLWKPVSGRPDELTILLREAVERRIRSPKKFQPKQDAAFDFEFAIPGTTEGDPVYLQLNGKRYDFDVFAAGQADPADEILSFYQAAYLTLRDASLQDFARLYTDASREKYLDWIAKCAPKYLESYHKDKTTAGRKVVLIINADPFYFIFYRKNNGVIEFDDVVRDPTDGKLKLTNFFYNDYIHHYLKSKKLFRDPVLEALVEEPP